MKTISIFLALINSLTAGVLLASSLTGSGSHQAAALWLLTKIFAGVFVITIGILTWFGSIRPIGPGVLALGSLFLVALGAATIVWTIHVAIMSGDMEFYMVGFGISLMIQGMTSLLGFAGESRNLAPS
jgi:hypothetical protein